MNSVQLPPIGSVANSSSSSSGTGGGEASSSGGAAVQPQKTTAAPPPPPKPAAPPAPQVPVAERAAAAAAQGAEIAREETPAFALDVGLIHGSFKVFVDVTDRDSHRFIARVYGPKGQVAPPPPTVKRTVTA